MDYKYCVRRYTVDQALMDTWINDKTCQQDLAKLEEEEFNDESK